MAKTKKKSKSKKKSTKTTKKVSVSKKKAKSNMKSKSKKAAKSTSKAKTSKKVKAAASSSAPTLEGKKVPKFKGAMTSGKALSSSDLSTGWTVLYFYPKDNTSGCTLEGQNFRDSYKRFQDLGVKIVGVSPDSLKSHERFKEAQRFPFELLSDEDKSVAEAFKVWKEKSMYGRKYFGVERSTFLVGPDGKIHKEWRKVKVPGHVDEVLAAVKDAH